jgi:GNAT superfamily N-acetyltransferase
MLSIRRAGNADIEALTALRVALLREIGKIKDAEEERRLYTLTRSYLSRALPAGKLLAWVAEADRQIVATGALVFLEKPPSPENSSGLEGHILNMYTLPAWRGRGLAGTILRHMIDYTQRETGARRLWLRATAAGRPLYERVGFVNTTREMELVW